MDTLACRYLHDTGEFDLGNAAHQQLLMDACSDASLVVIDNVTFTLTAPDGRSIYDPETVNQLKPLIAWARTTGKCLLLVDHTNANGDIFGSKHKAKMANFMLKLEVDDSKDDLTFNGTWTKYRGGPTPKPFEASLKALGWEVKDALSLKDKIRAAIHAGEDPKDIIDEFGKTNYYRYRR